MEERFQSDVEVILAHRHDLGGDFWTTPDKRLSKGSPFSTLESVSYLLELGMSPLSPLLKETADLIFSTWQEDGRFKTCPTGTIYPCMTINAANMLALLGQAEDPRLQTTFRYLLETQFGDGGWRCNKFSFGKGPETDSSNPFPTLIALNAFRFSEHFNGEPALDNAVDFLLAHWTVRKPIGPCHYGIGTLFMQVEYPFRNYNLFQYVHVLSHYRRARTDERFHEALSVLQSKTVDGQVVIERCVPKLAGLSFCRKGKPSELATARFQEIMANLR